MSLIKKKQKLLLFVSLASTCLIFAHVIINRSLNTSINASMNSSSNNEEVVLSFSENITEFKDINDLVKYSHNIVIGKVDGKSSFDEGIDEYVFDVEKELMGKVTSKYINIYENKGSLEVGERYLIFLESWERELFPQTGYTSIDERAIMQISNGIIDTNFFLTEKYNERDIEKIIKNYSEVKIANNKITGSEEIKVIDSIDSIEELSNQSDLIAKIKPNQIIYENKYVKEITFEILDQYKGTINAKTLRVPSSVEIDNNYIIFLKEKENGNYTLATRNGSVISEKDTEKWEAVESSFQRKNGDYEIKSMN